MVKKKLSITNFSPKSGEGIVSYNLNADKTISNSYGICEATFPRYRDSDKYAPLKITQSNITKIQNISHFQQYFPTSQDTENRLLVYASDKKLYMNQLFCNSSMLYWLYELEFDSEPISLTYKKDNLDTIILASADKMVVWMTNYTPYQVPDVPTITSMCTLNNTLYCTIKEPALKIWYSYDFDITKVGSISANSNYILLRDDLGFARKVVTFNDEVYIFRDYGISKITNIKGQLTISQVYQSNSLIYSNTISTSSSCVVFMTHEGLYTFNGYNVKKLDFKFDFSLINADAVASSLGENYYLAFKHNYNDNQKVLCENDDCVNNSLLILNTQNFNFQLLRGMDVKGMLPVKTDVFQKMLLWFNTGYETKVGEICNSSVYFDNNLPKMWQSENLTSDFDRKLFTKVSVEAQAGVSFKIIFDDITLNFETKNNGISEFCFKIASKTVKLEISSSNESLQVKKAEFEYYVN